MLADRRRQGRPTDEWAGGSAPRPNSGTASRAMLCLAHDGAKGGQESPVLSPTSAFREPHRHLEGSQLPWGSDPLPGLPRSSLPVYIDLPISNNRVLVGTLPAPTHQAWKRLHGS